MPDDCNPGIPDNSRIHRQGLAVIELTRLLRQINAFLELFTVNPMIALASHMLLTQ